MSKHDISKLSALYTAGEKADSPIFAEMRTNVLLYSSEHFKNISDKLQSRLQDSTLSQEQRLKLSINHIQCIVKMYVNNLLSEAPNVHFTPANPKELADKKDADLSQGVWAAGCEKQNFKNKRDKFAHSFVTMGEMVGFIYQDPTKGEFLGYNQKTDEEGNPLHEHPVFGETTQTHDEMGQPLEMVAGDTAKFSGELVMEVVHPPNLIRPENTETLDDAPWLCIHKMVSLKEAEGIIEGLPAEEFEEKKKFITESGQSTFTVMDGGRGEYRHQKDKCQLRYFYFRPCPDYPKGYVYITSADNGILFEAELPFGIFPIVTEGFDEIPTSPRSRSIIKPLRPVQIEINRLASAQALNSIIFGDTKVFLQNGTKMSKGNRYDGVREYYINGAPPVFQEGRAGVEQFASAIKEKVSEMYRLANIDLEMADTGQASDPTSIIYKSKSQKKKYMLYAQKFEGFLARFALLYIELAKKYLPDDALIRAVGKREAINIAEFRNVSAKSLRVRAVPVSGDADDLFLKHLSVQAALQYGGDMPQHIRAKLIKGMPFIGEGDLDGLTLNQDNVESDILALDRGEQRPARPTDDHALYIEMLVNRTKQSDFGMLPPQVQQMYAQKINEHEQTQADQIRKMKQIEESLIPSGAPFVKCDLYENVKGAQGELTNKVVKAVFPMGALLWLRQRLDDQGQNQAILQGLGDQQTQLDVLIKSGMLNQQNFQQQTLQQQGQLNNGPTLNMQAQSSPA